MVKVYLNKAFKNHPRGTVLDVSPRVHQLLIDRGCVAEPKPEKKSSKKEKTEEKKESSDS